MICLGITGGIGSGKTAVCKILETLGAQVFYADIEAKKLMTDTPSLREKVITLLGKECYIKTTDGPWRLNAGYIARTVFSPENTSLLSQLNQLVHPAVQGAFDARRRRAQERDVPALVFEAALLLESGSYKKMDSIWVVTAPLETRIQRVLDRDTITREAIVQRIQNQLSQEEMMSQATHIVENSGDVDHLKLQVQVAWKALFRN